ncbi:nitroreductase family protein [Coraliomargarita sinensis]|uniref:Nitroreductase family protein n=1 Tax=Coraliomargarita sinensis TaxID=2174842 RepID=A0A317ZLT9_9BACT|nr:nitroreductase family protein [Coraliomargarita sinensis]PXA05193.1 nitroreductase family protein [Coraliomargarita sinensis]
MDTLSAIRERRSVKHFDPEHEMTETEINGLLELTLLSPTSFNMQNWRFVVVTDQAKKDALRAASWNQAQVSEASLTILICADLNAHVDAERYWVNAPTAVREVLVPMIAPFYEDNPQLQRDEAMRSVGIASQTLMLAAKAMGYDSCPMIGFDPAKVAEIIDLPENHLIGMMLTIGKPLKDANARGGQLPYEDVVFRDGFPKKA